MIVMEGKDKLNIECELRQKSVVMYIGDWKLEKQQEQCDYDTWI